MIVVDGAAHTHKDGVEGNGGSLKDGAECRGPHAVSARCSTGSEA